MLWLELFLVLVQCFSFSHSTGKKASALTGCSRPAHGTVCTNGLACDAVFSHSRDLRVGSGQAIERAFGSILALQYEPTQ